jgi:phenylpyruvate tautomerase PptA (4-oxalocrotonate tautomerase family)
MYKKGEIFMPYISFKTTRVLTLQQELDLKRTAGELITLLPGKSEDYLMIHIEDNQLMYFGGKDVETMMITCKVYGHPSIDSKQEFVRKLIKEAERITGVPSKNIYLTISDYDHWGMNGELI